MSVIGRGVQQECYINAWQATKISVAEHAEVCVCRNDLCIHQVLYNSKPPFAYIEERHTVFY